jgi:hypothetical protein
MNILLNKCDPRHVFLLALSIIIAVTIGNPQLSSAGSEPELAQNQTTPSLEPVPSQPSHNSLEIGQQSGSSSSPLQTPQRQSGARSHRERPLTDWPSTLTGCWRRTPRRSECSTAMGNTNVLCPIPHYFHLQEICFDVPSGASVSARVTESHSHTDHFEITDDDANDRVTSYATIRQMRLYPDQRIDLLIESEQGESSPEPGSRTVTLMHSYQMQIVYGSVGYARRKNMIYVFAGGHWECGGANYFNTQQSGEFVKVPPQRPD